MHSARCSAPLYAGVRMLTRGCNSAFIFCVVDLLDSTAQGKLKFQIIAWPVALPASTRVHFSEIRRPRRVRIAPSSNEGGLGNADLARLFLQIHDYRDYQSPVGP